MRLDHVGRQALALRVQHLQADDVRPGRHAARLVEPVRARRRDDAGHVRPVPVLVEPRTAIVREVLARDDAPAQLRHHRHA